MKLNKFRKSSIFMLITCLISTTLFAGKITNYKPAEITLLKVFPHKLFLQQGKDSGGTVKIKNNSSAFKKISIKVWLTNNLYSATGEQNKQVELKGGEIKETEFVWGGNTLRKYGHTMFAEIRSAGKLLASGEDYFVSADSVWEVGIAGFHPVAFTADITKNKQIEAALNLYRKKYVNSYEKFFWAEDDFANMTPEKDTWYSGQARYHESKKYLKYLATYGRKIGVLPTTYGKSIGSGTGARDTILKHPEMVWGYGGIMDFHPDTEELAKWDKKAKKYWQATGWANYNMNDPAVVAYGIEQIIKSTKMFGWAGVRFDGHFAAKTGKRRVGDKIINFSQDMADKQTANNIATLKKRALAVFPDFIFGYNYAQCVFDKKLNLSPRESIELCKNGGMIMDEYAKAIQGGAHPYRNWNDFADIILKQSIIIKRLGGHLFVIIHARDIIGHYQNILVMAGGGHPYETTWGINHSYTAFATRYAGILWDKRIKNIWNPEGLIIINPGVIWKNYVKEINLDPKKKRLLIHLINPPLQTTATESYTVQQDFKTREKLRKEIMQNARLKKTKPDFTEFNKLPAIERFPRPQKNIKVKFVPQAMNFAWEITKVSLLDADKVSQQELSVDKSDKYFNQITVPELKKWVILVIDLSKKGK